MLSGGPPRRQENRGGLQDLPHVDMVRPITRYARTVREPALVLQELDEAVSRAQGQGGEPGPVYLDFPTDTLRGEVPRPLQLEEHFRAKPRPVLIPGQTDVAAAVDLLWSAKRPLVISGRGARGAVPELRAFLDALGAPYLDTGESKGLISDDHPCAIAAMRGTVMGQADVVVTIGRRLDFQLAYGSPAVFGAAKFLRIGDTPSEIRDNRRGLVECSMSWFLPRRARRMESPGWRGCPTCSRWRPGTKPNESGATADRSRCCAGWRACRPRRRSSRLSPPSPPS